jgi:NAD(P)-dependent dehydrogenase (short-subunit alcohol dehydrogenase family)
VLVADLQDDVGADLEKRFAGQLAYAHCDVTREADIARALARAGEAFGGLDILFNNAGTGGMPGGVKKMTAEGWDATFALLVRAPALGIRHAYPLMKARGGSIINTASIAGLQAGYGAFAYSTAKAAVIHMTRCAAAELAANNIRVNAICPGVIATPSFGARAGASADEKAQVAAAVAERAVGVQPIHKAGLPADVARAALYLASDDAAFVTGIHLIADGGLTVGPRFSWDRDAPRLIDALLPPG